MTREEIVAFLKAEVEPLPDDFAGNRYRAAARLTDGTYLPCVVFENSARRVDLAIKRFREENYDRSIIETFVSGTSCLQDYDIHSVEQSPFAWPLSILRMIHSETAMSWTAFVVEMKDESKFSYGTAFQMEFFDLPQGYAHTDIKIIHSGMISSGAEGMQPYSLDRRTRARIFREKPFFTSYVKGL